MNLELHPTGCRLHSEKRVRQEQCLTGNVEPSSAISIPAFYCDRKLKQPAAPPVTPRLRSGCRLCLHNLVVQLTFHAGHRFMSIRPGRAIAVSRLWISDLLPITYPKHRLETAVNHGLLVVPNVDASGAGHVQQPRPPTCSSIQQHIYGR